MRTERVALTGGTIVKHRWYGIVGTALLVGILFPTLLISQTPQNAPAPGPYARIAIMRALDGHTVDWIFSPKWLQGRVVAEKMVRALGCAAADGVLAEYTVFDEASVVHVPAHLTDEEAATLPCAGVTAWNALSSFADITPGDSVVVLGTGGVSIFALQFARMRGARVIITSSTGRMPSRS